MYRTFQRTLLFAALLGLALPAYAQSLSRSSGPASGASAAPAAAFGLPGTTITQSATQNIVALNSVSCNAGGLHTDNSYIRVFDLAAEGIAGDFDVTNVEIGVETATGLGGTQPIELRLYTLTGPLALGNLSLLGTVATTISDQSLSFFSFPVPTITAPAGAQLAVEVFTPNGQADGNSFFIGSNPDGQTGPSYIVAADCGAVEPTDVAVLGFPGMHIVMNVTGNEVSAVPDVDIEYLGSTADPQRGDFVFVRAQGTNNEATTVRTRVYTEVLYPDGVTRRYSVGSSNFPANTTLQIHQTKRIKFPIPTDAPAGTYTVTLFAADDLANGGTIYDTDSFTFDLAPLVTKTGEGGDEDGPTTDGLTASPEAGPNPFRTATTIRYEVATDADVDLRVFDVAGREVATLASGVQSAGVQRAVFTAGDLPSGVYVWRLAVNGEVTTGRVTLAR